MALSPVSDPKNIAAFYFASAAVGYGGMQFAGRLGYGALATVWSGHLTPPSAIAEVQLAIQGGVQTGNYALKANGLFEGTTQINGVAVGFRGRFVDGVARVATVFTKQ